MSNVIIKFKKWLKSEECLNENKPLTNEELKDIQGYLRARLCENKTFQKCLNENKERFD